MIALCSNSYKIYLKITLAKCFTSIKLNSSNDKMMAGSGMHCATRFELALFAPAAELALHQSASEHNSHLNAINIKELRWVKNAATWEFK